MKKGKYYCEVFIDGWEWYPDEESEDAELDESVYESYILLPNGRWGSCRGNCYCNTMPRDYKFWRRHPHKELTFDDVALPKAEDFIDIIIKDYRETIDIFAEVTIMRYDVLNEKNHTVLCAVARPAEDKPLIIKDYINQREIVVQE